MNEKKMKGKLKFIVYSLSRPSVRRTDKSNEKINSQQL